MNVLQREPVIAFAALAAAVNAGQIPISLPTWVHVLLAVVTILAAGHGARRQVTPTTGP